MKNNSFRLLLAICLFAIACGESEVKKSATADTPIEKIDSLVWINDKIVADASNPELYHQRAQMLLERGEVDQAMNDAQRAIGLDSIVSKYHVLKGELFLRQANIAMAKSSYDLALEIDPKNKKAHIKLALYYLGLTNYSQALKSADNALRIDVQDPKTYFVKGRIFLAAEDTTRALSSFQTATEMKPNYFEAFLLLGVINASRGEAIAENYYNSALEIEPKNTKALYSLGHLQMSQNNFPEAFKTFSKISEITPTDPIPYFNLGHMYMENNIDSSIVYYSKAIALSPDYFQAFYNRGLCYEALEQLENSESDYRAALELKPDYDLAIEGLNRIIP